MRTKPQPALLALLIGLCACPSKTCEPHQQTCDHDTILTCSSTGHGFTAGGRPEVPCAAVGAHCVIEQGRGRCAFDDAGASRPDDAGDGGVDP